MEGWMWGIVGSAVGVAGAIFGTWCSIRNTQSVPERRYITRWAVYLWLGCTAFLALLFLLPHPYRYLVWIPYAPLLTWAIVACNKGQARIRAEQGQAQSQL